MNISTKILKSIEYVIIRQNFVYTYTKPTNQNSTNNRRITEKKILLEY